MNIYIYPTYTPSRDKSGNLYIKYFHDCFRKVNNVKIVNRLWQMGISSIAFNLDANVFVIQWVDLIPGKRFGKIQFVLYLLLVSLISFMGRRIVWVLHNKHAHNGASKWVDIGMDFMAKHATFVITHSKEGVTFFNNRYPKYKGKCRYIPHPVYTKELYVSEKTIYDYVIWGTVSRRKDVLGFLRFAVNSKEMQSKRILVIGRCLDSQYEKSIIETIRGNEGIEFRNKFVSDEELKRVLSCCRVILFTYNSETLLSSGALIYSLNFCKPIIGPNAGGFSDLKEIVSVYNDFSEIPTLSTKPNREACEKYINENTWDLFPDKLIDLLIPSKVINMEGEKNCRLYLI